MINITPDVQYIHPEASAIADDAFVYGVRMNIKLYCRGSIGSSETQQ